MHPAIMRGAEPTCNIQDFCDKCKCVEVYLLVLIMLCFGASHDNIKPSPSSAEVLLKRQHTQLQQQRHHQKNYWKHHQKHYQKNYRGQAQQSLMLLMLFLQATICEFRICRILEPLTA
jgi:hypothetical protein